MKPKIIFFLCFLSIVFWGCTYNPASLSAPTEKTENKVTESPFSPTPTFQPILQQPTQSPILEVTPTLIPKDDISLILQGQLGGSSDALAVSDQYIYLGVGPRLVVIDTAIPNTLSKAGQTDLLPGVVNGVIVKDGHAYIITKAGYFGVMSLSNPLKPQLIGTLELQERAVGFTLDNKYAYLASGKDGFQIIDISNKEIPTLVGSVTTLYDSTAIALINNYVYLTERNTLDINGALQVFDISDPLSPQIVSSLDLSNFSQAIVISGGNAYLASNGLVVVDITDPTSPRQIGIYEEDEFYDDIAIADGFAFISTNQYCDVVSVCPRQIRVIDIREPSNPQPPNVPIAKDIWSDQGMGRAFVVHNGSIYVTTQNGLNIIEASTLTIIGQYNSVGSVNNVEVLNGYGYTVDGYNSLQIVDVNTSANPTPIGYLQCDGCVMLDQVCVSNGFAYLSLWDFGFEVVNTKNLHQPTSLTRYEIRGGNVRMAVDNNHLYVIPDTTIFDPTVSPRLHIFDVQNPAQPLEVNALEISGSRYSKIVLRNGYAYLGSEGRLEIIDISHSEIPEFVGEFLIDYDRASYWWSMTVEGKFAYFVRQAMIEPFQIELIVIDLSDLSHPKQTAILSLSQGGSDVAATPGLVYVLGFEGMSVVDVTDPTHPRETYVTDFGGQKIQVDGDYVYIAGGEKGLFILQAIPNE